MCFAFVDLLKALEEMFHFKTPDCKWQVGIAINVMLNFSNKCIHHFVGQVWVRLHNIPKYILTREKLYEKLVPCYM